MYHAACEVRFQSFNLSYSQLMICNFLSNLLVLAIATTACCPHKSSLVLKRLLLSLHLGPAQLLYFASEIALALLAHPVAAARAAIFPNRQSALLACKKGAGTNKDAE